MSDERAEPKESSAGQQSAALSSDETLHIDGCYLPGGHEGPCVAPDEKAASVRELVAAVQAFLAELDTAIAHDECGECPPTVETQQRLRAAVRAIEQEAGAP